MHATLILLGAVLYFLFVLPRWWVLTGDMPGTLATAGRIAAGLPIALAAIPVVIALQRGLKPADQTPELALRLRAWSAVLHLIAGALILLAAVAEIWLGLGAAGPWLFGVYGAAAAIAILGVLAFYLSYWAENPPAVRKERKFRLPKLRKRGTTDAPIADAATDTVDEIDSTEGAETTPTAKPRRFGRKRKAQAAVEEATEVETSPSETTEVAETEAVEAIETEVAETEAVAVTATDVTETEVAETEVVATGTAEPVTAGGLQNKRPTGKSRHRLPR